MVIKIVLLILWIIASLCEGKRDGFFYNYRTNSTNTDNHNLHWLFVLERFLILSMICWIHILSNSTLNTGVFVFSLILIFSWFHNGQYYRTRNMLDKKIYPKGWWDTSTTSESVLEFNATSRTFMVMVGIVGIMASFTFK